MIMLPYLIVMLMVLSSGFSTPTGEANNFMNQIERPHQRGPWMTRLSPWETRPPGSIFVPNDEDGQENNGKWVFLGDNIFGNTDDLLETDRMARVTGHNEGEPRQLCDFNTVNVDYPRERPLFILQEQNCTEKIFHLHNQILKCVQHRTALAFNSQIHAVRTGCVIVRANNE